MDDAFSDPSLYGLIFILVMILGSMLLYGPRLGQTLRNAAIWALIFIGAALVGSYWPDVRDRIASRQLVSDQGARIEAQRGSGGHFYLTLDINAVPITFIVDTGATDVVLSTADAKRVGIDLDSLIYSGTASTANGTVRTARVTLDKVTIGGFDEGSLRASVNEGELDTSLLGMAYLRRFSRVEIAGDRMVFER